MNVRYFIRERSQAAQPETIGGCTKMRNARFFDNKTGSILLTARSVFSPRIWKVLVLAAYPFFLLAWKYFEALERTGTIGAFIADTAFVPTLIAYAALIYILKKRAI